MKSKLVLLVFFLALPLTSIAKDLTLSNAPTQVYFSPHGGCTKAIVSELGKAKSVILVQAYSFTSRAIAEAILNAYKRGVSIQIILDKSNLRHNYSAADFTAHAGIPTYIDAQHSIAHNKIMIIDNEVVMTGSFNFTRAAEVNNAENLLIIRSKELAKIYVDNWQEHKGHSEIYKGR